MRRIGIALSGGGFRATLYHLGVLRYLRDADLLNQVSHITSVSGGSIMAAHLVLHWDRYTGTDEAYDEVAQELLDFTRMDVRNRVVRRYPFAFALNCLRRILGLGWSRRLTRPGLLESHYEKFLYGDKCLYELPAVPQLHMLATNVNEGCLCSFTRSGLLVQRRVPGGETRFESVPSALATVPMAVTASSAFPGFFPPLHLTARDVGAEESRFTPHLFTDGGVYDNLGVRMFRNIQETWIGHDAPLQPDEFVDLSVACEVLGDAAVSAGETPLGRLAQCVVARMAIGKSGAGDIRPSLLPSCLWNVIVHDKLYLDPVFEQIDLGDEQASDLFRLSRRGHRLDSGEHLWLNRCLANAAFAQANKGDLLVSSKPKIDTVIVSDAGKQFTVSRRTKGGGLLGTAMRASEIVMDRVWELENSHFHSEPDFIFAPMSLTVHPSEDPTALHPELQQQVTATRTDLDQFSELEISGLVRHGYGVMRKVCRSRPDLFGDSSATGPPWDPTEIAASSLAGSSPRTANLITTQARELQDSSQRQILGRLLSWRDWPTYVFVPLLLLLFVGLPYYAYQNYKLANRSEMIVDAITFSNPDFQLVLQIARENPIPGQWESLAVEEVPQLQPTDLGGFRLITDTRILDTRAWQPDSSSHENRIVSYRRMLVRRIGPNDATELGSPNDTGRIRIQQFSRTEEVLLRSSSTNLSPVIRKSPGTFHGENGFMYEAEFDLSTVPKGEDFDIGFELTNSGIQGREEVQRRLIFPIIAPTEVATMWVILPVGHPYGEFEIVADDRAAGGLVESIEPTYRFEMNDGSLFGWMLMAPRDETVYECRWSIRDE